MSKKQRLSEFNRNNILNAAKQLFLEKGITQATMDNIAKQAECSKSTIYVYFKSKEEIFDYIILEYFTLLKDGIEDALADAKDFPDGFFAICNTAARFYDDYPLYFDSILSEIKITEDESNSALFQIYVVGEQINDMMESYFKTHISNGSIRNDLPSLPQTIFALWGGICGIILLANKKEEYIRHRMQVSKEVFMQNGFTLLLQSILPQRGA
jgi:AcrR family transcriptional regulator